MESIDIDFDATSQVVYLIGAGSCAVPGAVAGLEAAHERYGSLPWRRLLEPAIDLAREGVELTPQQAYLHAILDLILRHAPEGRAIYGESGRLTAGERVVMRDLAATLERLAEGGARELYRGELGRELVRFLAENGGLVTRADLEDYRVIWRRPSRVSYEGREFVSNPPPSSGGVLIGYGLSLLDRLGGRRKARQRGGDRAARRGHARAVAGADGELRRGPLPGRARAQALSRRRTSGRPCDRIERREASVPEAGGARRDHAHLGRRRAGKRGLAHRLDRLWLRRDRARHRHPHEQHARRVRPEPSGQANAARDAAHEHDGAVDRARRRRRPRLVVGSAGSLRLRGAILQIVVNVVHHGMPVEEAIEAPRVHFDDGHVHCEGGSDPAELERLEARGYDLVRWRRQNLYFGGAAAVERRADGSLAAAGDPRRGGHGIVVPA